MCAQVTSAPPSLDRGLQALTVIAQYPDGLRHSEILRLCGWSKTATTRILQHLLELGYLSQSPIDHRYRSAAQTQLLSPSQSSQIELLHIGEPIIKQLAQETQWSAVLLYWNGNDVICLSRHITKNNCSLQQPGHITRNRVDNPYHVFFLSQLQWRRLKLERTGDLAIGLNHAWYTKEQERFKQDGYTAATNGKRLRIAAPLIRNEHCIGAIMLGHKNIRTGHKKVGKQLARACVDFFENN